MKYFCAEAVKIPVLSAFSTCTCPSPTVGVGPDAKNTRTPLVVAPSEPIRCTSRFCTVTSAESVCVTLSYCTLLEVSVTFTPCPPKTRLPRTPLTPPLEHTSVPARKLAVQGMAARIPAQGGRGFSTLAGH